MSDKTKKRKFLNKLCPDCESKSLEIITHTVIINNVKYFEDFIECLECEYSEKIHVPARKNKDEFKEKWT
jgi:hypothetical protein